MARISEYSPANKPLTGSEVIVLNQNNVTHNTTVSALAESLPNQTYLNGKEDNLGNPSVDGSVLHSTTSGIRYWQPIYTTLEYFSEIYTYTTPIALYDLVCQTGNNKEVIKVIDNKSVNPIIGIVTNVVSSFEVQVTHNGIFNVTDILQEGKKVFISTSGTLTTNVPGSDYIQVLGQAIKSNRLNFMPELHRTKRLEL